MKIVRMTSLGVRRTFSPEMKSGRHNYITDHSGAVHRNSHAVAYCLVAYRCLWLKAHYPPEWWAAVMSDCHPTKLARYMGVARDEGVKFTTLNIDRLTINFDVSGEKINPGLIGLKKVGMAASRAFEANPDHYEDIDQFVAAHPRNKTVLERLIKLGAFGHLPGHQNRYALWNWYLYRYGSGREAGEVRRQVRERLLQRQGWDDESVRRERQRQIHEYRLRYPKRNKVPDKLLNWTPKPGDGRDEVTGLFPLDYTTPELLTFEKEYLGYYMSNPLERYEYCYDFSIRKAKRDTVGPVHAVIMKVDFGQTKKGDEMCRVTLYDGRSTSLLLLWSDDCDKYRDILTSAQEALTREIKPKADREQQPEKPVAKYEIGVGVNVRYSAAKGQGARSFTLLRQGRTMWLLPPTKTQPTHVVTR